MPPAARPETASSAPARRRRIHEIDSAFHCMIVGSCLGVDELRKLAARVRSPLPPDATDFEVHACVVHAMGTAGAMAKLVQKRLDRKYRAQIQQCAKLATVADLRRWWDECAARGDFVGAFWAAMTHPAATGAFRTELFGEIHMLSHLEGATNRAFRRRLAAVERAAEAAAAEAAAMRGRLARAMTGNDALRDRIRRVEAENRRLSRLEDGAELRALQARAEALERLADRARTEGCAASGRLADHAAELRGRDDEIAALRRSLATAERECAALGDPSPENRARGRRGGPRRPRRRAHRPRRPRRRLCRRGAPACSDISAPWSRAPTGVSSITTAGSRTTIANSAIRQVGVMWCCAPSIA